MTSKNKAGGSSSHGEYEDFDWGQVSLDTKETSSLHYDKISPVSRPGLVSILSHTLMQG